MTEDTADTVVFNRTSNEITHDEMWDDELLIVQYNNSLKKARNQLAVKLQETSSVTDSDCSSQQANKILNNYSRNKSKKKKGRKKIQWHTGDPCRACYLQDGEIYEATIIGLKQQEGTCVVRYVGYDNHEEVALSSLIKTDGEKARKQQTKAAESNNEIPSKIINDESSVIGDGRRNKKPKKYKQISSSVPPSYHDQFPSSIPHLPNLPPPPALGLVDEGDSESTEALHTMLMSWYMTGYHTGYYQGLSHGKKSSVKSVPSK